MTYYAVGTNKAKETEVIDLDGIDELVGMVGESLDKVDYVIEGNIVSDEVIRERWNANNL